jgi:hypothetical protein
VHDGDEAAVLDHRDVKDGDRKQGGVRGRHHRRLHQGSRPQLCHRAREGRLRGNGFIS